MPRDPSAVWHGRWEASDLGVRWCPEYEQRARHTARVQAAKADRKQPVKVWRRHGPKIDRLRREGLTWRAIEVQFGLTANRCAEILKRYHWEQERRLFKIHWHWRQSQRDPNEK